MATFIRKLAISYAFLAIFLSAGIGVFLGVESFGINYGQVANNLPQPDKVLELLSTLNLTKSRIYDTNPQILSSFANSNIEIIVTVENEILSQLDDPQQALQWVNSRVMPYLPETKITGVQVGNEVFTDDDTTLIQHLVPAVVNIHNALAQLGYSNIKVSTPSSLAVLDQSYPPSAGSFKSEISGIMYQFLNFLSNSKSPFWINAYPYFAYKDDPSAIPLNYVLFNPNAGMVDPYTNLHYDNMLYAMVDAVSFAIAKMGFKGIEVRVSETGWPSKGDPNEVGATPMNAATYNRNLLRRQMASEGTPLYPRMRLEVYLFALFNEDLKPGPTSERNYGLFRPDESMTYNVGLSALATSSSSSSISLASSAAKIKVAAWEYKSLVNWMLVYVKIVTNTLSKQLGSKITQEERNSSGKWKITQRQVAMLTSTYPTISH
ncbi:Glucan endo-1,3-beta-glucosidase 14 [Mucuna pruriens]|uniref:glucan endo-1,3-beta-D-glucosidase n=1 Tax=Mucuna pruriens TaxID=157652 RepID=A0A371FS09_MUCPR|nr:Glucan endo-1,3-beta-glucosidase 14 [Mucuna pruriens]